MNRPATPRPSTIPAPDAKVNRRRTVPLAWYRRLPLIAVVLSVVIHAAIATFIVWRPSVAKKPEKLPQGGSVELLMIEQKGAQPHLASQAKPSPQTSKLAAKTDTSNPQAPKADQPGKDPPSAPPPTPASGTVALKAASAATAQATAQPDAVSEQKKSEPQPIVRPAPKAPSFDLAGTESESNAIAMGRQIVPAMADDRFRNRPPIYPVEAEVHNEHGTVIVVIHISADGTAAGADISQSSGYDVLDQATLTAVQKWHFRPAIKDGHTIPSDMPFRFVFEPY